MSHKADHAVWDEPDIEGSLSMTGLADVAVTPSGRNIRGWGGV